MKVVKNLKKTPFGRSLCNIVKCVNCFVMCQVYLSGIDVTACYITGPMHAIFIMFFIPSAHRQNLKCHFCLHVFVELIKVSGYLQN